MEQMPQPIPEKDPPEASLRQRFVSGPQCGGSGILAVVYSQVRVPEGRFGLERLFMDTRHTCLFLNDLRWRWYEGQTEAVDAAIDAAIAQAKPSRIIHYGSSMGGHAALAAGLRRGDGEVHSFGPELEPGRPGTQSADYGLPHPGTAAQALTLAPEFAKLETPPAHPLHFYFGHFDAADAAGAARVLSRKEPVPGMAGIHVHELASCHASHDHLYALNVIRKIIRTFERDPAAELAARDLLRPLPPAFYAGFSQAAELLAQGAVPEEADLLHLAGLAPDHIGLLRLRANAAAARADLESALALMTQAEAQIASHPGLAALPKRWRKDLTLARIRWMADLGRQAAAAELLRSLGVQMPHDAKVLALAGELGINLPES
ncbi:Uncharacterised protein [Pannonibacter phragmitetus]|uniref:Alpha/beta hydrolase n=1 Tax=Pannonibacter phragmitetus TaxID=121719 RepID=A0A378ZPE3_9HYPH|nr:hypothetical protein [Pannonibacter phragmitetus]SUA99126.1 Uncharacterised protein [Pannonibacter phragmitetus]